MNPLKETISWLKSKVQEDLFPYLQSCFPDPMTDKQKRLITILEIVQVENYVKTPELQWMGRKLVDRYPIARAFVAKAVYRFPTTRALMEGLNTMPNLRSIRGFSGSGFRTVKKARLENGKMVVERTQESALPSEATFSRAFAEFTASELGDRVLNEEERDASGQTDRANSGGGASGTADHLHRRNQEECPGIQRDVDRPQAACGYERQWASAQRRAHLGVIA